MSRQLLMALDIGGVCLRLYPERLLPFLGAATPAAIPPALWLASTAYETGKLNDGEFADAVRKLLKQPELGNDAIFHAWNSILGEAVEGMAGLVERWSAAGHRFVFFSDTNPAHLRRSRGIFPAARWVPEGIYSFETGARKPEAPMFAAFERRFRRPDLYIDDRNECLAGGEKFSWPTWRFTGAAALEERLNQLKES